MAFTNSKLATYVSISPNRTINRNQPITKITIHHMAGVCSLEEFDSIVKNPNRQMSSNYAIGSDGRVGLFCDEKDRSWCSSSAANDLVAITIEVSNSAYGDASGWPISEKVYAKLIDLCVDICQRNNIKQLTFTGDKNGSLTYHYMFSSTQCPGPWIKAHTQDICNKVNTRLNNSSSTNTNNGTITNNTSFRQGDLVSVNKGACWYTGSNIPDWVYDEKWYISSISGDRAVLGQNESKNRNIQSPVSTNNISLISGNNDNNKFPYKVTLNACDVYNENGDVVSSINSSGIFTIIDEKTVDNVVYGKLKSGAGWVIIHSSNDEANVDNKIKKGSLVSLSNDASYYNGTTIPAWVKSQRWYIDSIVGDRAVLGQNESKNRNIQSPVNIKYLVV